jgi:hypothetical protein
VSPIKPFIAEFKRRRVFRMAALWYNGITRSIKMVLLK